MPRHNYSTSSVSVYVRQTCNNLRSFTIGAQTQDDGSPLSGQTCSWMTAALLSGGFRGVRGVQMHLPLADSSIFCVRNCSSPSNGYAAVACSNNKLAVTHTHINSLLISRRLPRPRVASRYSVWISSYLIQLASYQSATIITCHKCISVTESGRGNSKFSECASCASGWTPLPKFLDPPLLLRTALSSPAN